MTVAQLKDELRNRGLKVSGRKHELVHRISKHDDATATNNDRSHCTGSETRGKFYNLPHDADESSVRIRRTTANDVPVVLRVVVQCRVVGLLVRHTLCAGVGAGWRPDYCRNRWFLRQRGLRRSSALQYHGQ